MLQDNTFKKYERYAQVFQDEEDDILLRLAFLKEHSGYRMFFTPEMRLAVETEYLRRELAPEFHPEDFPDVEPFHFYEDPPLPTGGNEEKISLGNFFMKLRAFGPIISINIMVGVHTKEWLDVLDPRIDARTLSERIRRMVLPRLFYNPSVKEIVPKNAWILDYDGFPILRHWQTLSFDCAPYQRLLKVDLRKKPSQLKKEFEAFLQVEEARRELDQNTYPEWRQDRTRKRKEAWRHLKVWQLWWQIQKPSFADIGRELGITDEAAKKSFQRAFELIYGIPFNRNVWNEKQAEFEKVYPEYFEQTEKWSTRESILVRFEEVSDAYSYQEWLTREEDNEF